MPAEQFAPGTEIRITGLKSKPELNGTIAIVEVLNEVTGRYNVKLPDGETLALKPEALGPKEEKPPPVPLSDEDERSVSVKANAGEWYPDQTLPITLKLTLAGKQLKKPLKTAVIAPFVKALTRKLQHGLTANEAYDKKDFTVDDVVGVKVDDFPIADPSIAASVVLLPKRTVNLELTLTSPPPPPPLLHKNVALTGLDTTAYRDVYNGMWAAVVAYDPLRGKYECLVGGDKANRIWVFPEAAIELVDKKVVVTEDDFDDFDGVLEHGLSAEEIKRRKEPVVGTTAHEIWQRQLPRWASEDAQRRRDNLARRAFHAVCITEQLQHVRVQIDQGRAKLAVQRSILKNDLGLGDVSSGNKVLKAIVEDTRTAKKELQGLQERIDFVQKNAERLYAEANEGDEPEIEEVAQPAGGDAAADACEDAAAADAADPAATPTAAVDVTDGDALQFGLRARKPDPANAPPEPPPAPLKPVSPEHAEKLAELREELALAVKMAEEHDGSDKAIKWHCEHRKEAPEWTRTDNESQLPKFKAMEIPEGRQGNKEQTAAQWNDRKHGW